MTPNVFKKAFKNRWKGTKGRRCLQKEDLPNVLSVASLSNRTLSMVLNSPDISYRGGQGGNVPAIAQDMTLEFNVRAKFERVCAFLLAGG